MADKSISELVAATVVGSTDLFVLEQSGTAKKLTGQILENWLVSYADGHGGIQSLVKTSSTGTDPVVDTYTITYADTSTSTFTVTNGKKGATGDQTYVWIKYSSREPVQDSDIYDTPDDWVGIYTGLASTAPTSYTEYTWYNWKGETGDPAELQSNAVAYQASESGTTIPYGTWVDTPPYVQPGQFLWTRIILDWNSGNPVVFYTVSRYGIDGQGSPGTATPLMDGTGAVGTSTSFSREDHVHPTDTSRASVTDTQYLPMWRGKKALVIGDSWIAGWSGSTSGTVESWSVEFLAMTGLIADLVILSGGGFTCEGSSSQIPPYQEPNTFVSVLDNYQDEDYDIIIVQGGVNDIRNEAATVDSIGTAIGNFMTKCSSYWANVPVYYFPCTPFYFLNNQVGSGETEVQNGKNNKAMALIHSAIEKRMLVARNSAKFPLYRNTYKGTPNGGSGGDGLITHPSEEGMKFFGRYAASFVNCGDFPEDYAQIAGDSSSIPYFMPDAAFSANTDSGAYRAYFVRMFKDTINLTVYFTGATSSTGMNNLLILSGVPVSAVNYQVGNAYVNTGSGLTIVPATVNKDQLLLDLSSNLNINGKTVTVYITYTTSSL